MWNILQFLCNLPNTMTVQDIWKLQRVCQKKNTWILREIRFSGLIRLKFLDVYSKPFVRRKTRHWSSPAQYNSHGERWWWEHRALGVFFSCGHRTTGSIWRKDKCSKIYKYPGRKPLLDSDWPEISPYNRAIILHTQLKCFGRALVVGFKNIP